MSDESTLNNQVEEIHLTPESKGFNNSVRVACLHCAYRGAASNTNDDPHVTSMVKCENCGLPMCNVCVEELEHGCPA